MAAIPWNKSQAKKILYGDIVDGKVTERMHYRMVYIMHSEYQQYAQNNFRTNLKNLLKSIRNNQEAANISHAALLQDMMILSTRPERLQGPKRWDGSRAQQLLKDDFTNGVHTTMKPMQLWLLREEYQEFSLDRFRNFINQEKRQGLERSYWLNKKRKK
jgi:hypothetical protein